MGRPWSFDGDGDLLRLVSEAYRINLAWLFDTYVAITTSIISPGSLTDQRQDELAEKFGLNFEILTGDMIQAARTAKPFEHKKPG